VAELYQLTEDLVERAAECHSHELHGFLGDQYDPILPGPLAPVD